MALDTNRVPPTAEEEWKPVDIHGGQALTLPTVEATSVTAPKIDWTGETYNHGTYNPGWTYEHKPIEEISALKAAGHEAMSKTLLNYEQEQAAAASQAARQHQTMRQMMSDSTTGFADTALRSALTQQGALDIQGQLQARQNDLRRIYEEARLRAAGINVDALSSAGNLNLGHQRLETEANMFTEGQVQSWAELGQTLSAENINALNAIYGNQATANAANALSAAQGNQSAALEAAAINQSGVLGAFNANTAYSNTLNANSLMEIMLNDGSFFGGASSAAGAGSVGNAGSAGDAAGGAAGGYETSYTGEVNTGANGSNVPLGAEASFTLPNGQTVVGSEEHMNAVAESTQPWENRDYDTMAANLNSTFKNRFKTKARLRAGILKSDFAAAFQNLTPKQQNKLLNSIKLKN